MDYLQGLLERVSCPILQDPAPNPEQLEQMLQAALRAPDHGNLKPYRFVVITGTARTQLGDQFVQRQLARDAANGEETDAFTQQKYRNMPLRAPMVLGVIACPQTHDKVPVAEQIQTTACAGQNILHAAHAQGLGGVWRTGWIAQDKVIHAYLGLNQDEQLIGFIYLGTPKYEKKTIAKIDSKAFVTFLD